MKRAGVIDAKFDDDPIAGLEGFGYSVEAAFACELYSLRVSLFFPHSVL